jgi:hypothetical protein
MYWSRYRTSCPLHDRHDSSLRCPDACLEVCRPRSCCQRSVTPRLGMKLLDPSAANYSGAYDGDRDKEIMRDSIPNGCSTRRRLYRSRSRACQARLSTTHDRGETLPLPRKEFPTPPSGGNRGLANARFPERCDPQRRRLFLCDHHFMRWAGTTIPAIRANLGKAGCPSTSSCSSMGSSSSPAEKWTGERPARNSPTMKRLYGGVSRRLSMSTSVSKLLPHRGCCFRRRGRKRLCVSADGS